MSKDDLQWLWKYRDTMHQFGTVCFVLNFFCLSTYEVYLSSVNERVNNLVPHFQT